MPDASVPTDPAEPSVVARPRLALIGCGKVGQIHRERLASESADIVAISDPDAEALASLAEMLPRRPHLYRSEQDLLTAGNLDGVIVCTPHAYHAAQVRAALDADVAVLCEKPFVTSGEDARTLVRLAREKKLPLFVAFTRRSRGHARFLKAAAKTIGPLTHVLITRAQPWLTRFQRTWRARGEGTGGGILVDAGASMLDLLLHLAGSPVESFDAQLTPRGGVHVDVRVSLHLRFRNGVRSDVMLLGDATEEIERIQLFGENGTAGWRMREDAPHDLYIRPAGGPSENGDVHHYRAPLPDAAFVAALQSGREFGPDDVPDRYDAASAVPVVELIERIYQEADWG